ncbi:hypothetical protein A4G26_04870 [Mycobacterium kansasii]|uniref:Uncharacterized protein n=1 Tax=Mycobacterium innocens TaxID=2341083 RepID=A0A498PYB7_9MYCO|nr:MULTISPECIES: hypothetical protein [Mycobacterium]KZS75729.1 hypothetical protein A4G26_04870 [Mycobacterium kansasii]VBA38011.1 hypothetical protein LAUMK13_01919 [Mycobacterium innocens]
MKQNGVRDIRARAWPGNSGRIQIQIGVFRFTALADEAVEFARQLVAAVDELRSGVQHAQ